MIVFHFSLGSFTCGTASLVNDLYKLNLGSSFSQTLSFHVSGAVGVKRQRIVENPIELWHRRLRLQKQGYKP